MRLHHDLASRNAAHRQFHECTTSSPLVCCDDQFRPTRLDSACQHICPQALRSCPTSLANMTMGACQQRMWYHPFHTMNGQCSLRCACTWKCRRHRIQEPSSNLWRCCDRSILHWLPSPQVVLALQHDNLGLGRWLLDL